MGPFEYNAQHSSYIVSNVPRLGFGFWIYTNMASTQEIGGIVLDTIAIPIYTGWNLIGSVTDTAWFTTDPPGLIAEDNVLTWDCETENYMLATEIVPGKAYWVLSVGNGVMTIRP